MRNSKVIKQASGENWNLYNTDCIEFMVNMPENSIDLSVFSPPFSQLYIYSEDIRDMGNCSDDADFFTGFNFFVKELYRITKPGRLAAVHCKQLVNYKNSNGKTGLRDFRGDIIRAFTNTDITSLLSVREILKNNREKTNVIDKLIEKNQQKSDNGWSFHSEVAIWKDPVIEMQRTKTQRLLYKQLKADASLSGIGLAEYMLLFRKWGTPENEIPVTHTEADINLNTWQKWASPVWDDIRQTHVLNTKLARENKDEKHICPLQLDVIERAVTMWSNPGEVVFDPFMGIGSTGYVALQLDRKTLGCELKQKYFNIAVRNLTSVQKKSKGLNIG